MRVKNFSALFVFLLAVFTIISLLVSVAVAKPSGPNPETWWRTGTIWGTNLRFENSDNVLTISEVWFGTRTSELKSLAPPDPPAGLIVEFVDDIGNNYAKWVKAAVAEPASYTWQVQFRKVKNTDPRGGKVSCTMENIDTRFVPQDYSVVLENTDLGLHINLRAGSDNVTGPNIRTTPILAALNVDNAVNIQSIENLDPLKGLAGDNVRLRVTVKNTGRYTDNYDVSAGGSIDSSILNLAPGSIDNVIVTTTMPAVVQDIVITVAGTYATDQDYITTLVAPHAPISITADNQFTSAKGVTSGSGTSEDPYIIEGWLINTENSNGIRIANTTAYFIIRNCSVSGAHHGTYWTNVHNGTVDTNTFSSSANYGIYIETSYNCTVENNTSSGTRGIYLSGCHDIDISGNSTSGGTNGILLYNSHSCDVSGNTCSSSTYGIELNICNDETVSNNGGSSNTYGIYLKGTMDNNITLYQNTFSSNTYGIYLNNARFSGLTQYVSISYNTCNNNTAGITLSAVNCASVENNVCSGNSSYGIYLTNCKSTVTLLNNTADSNGTSGILVYQCLHVLIWLNTCNSNDSGINFNQDNYCQVLTNTCTGNTYGFHAIGSSQYDNIDNNILTSNDYGIYLSSVQNDLITNNICSSNTTNGIQLSAADGNTFDGNTMGGNGGHGFYASATDVGTLTNNICENNGQEGIQLYTCTNFTIDSNMSDNNGGNGGIYLSTCDSDNIINNFARYNTISTTYYNGANGIDVYLCNNIVITGNDTTYNGINGIYLDHTENSIVSNNTASHTFTDKYYADGKFCVGILLEEANHNTISANTTENNGYDGIELDHANSYNTIENNTCDNNYKGIILYSSDNNLIYHNNFINNASQAYDNGTNYWDKGYPSGGNYWSDYTGPDANSDGIVDTPYYILGDNNQDRYPLTEPI